MKNLSDYYKQYSSDLEEKVQAANNYSEVCEALQSELKKITDINSEYVGNLTKSQARIALSMLETLNTTFQMIAKAEIQALESQTNTKEYSQEDWNRNDENSIEKMLSGLIGGAVGGGLRGGILGGALGAFLGAFTAAAASKTIELVKPSNKGIATQSNISFRVENSEYSSLNKNELLAYFREGLKLIDDVVTNYTSSPKSVEYKPAIEDHPDLLEFLQNLIGEMQIFDTQSSPIMKSRIKEVTSLLRRYGIRIQIHQDDISDLSSELFDFETSIDPELKSSFTLKPAFIKGDRLLLRGQVIEPDSSKDS